MNPIVETYKTDPTDFEPTPEQLDAYTRCLMADKGKTDEHLEIAATVTDECRELAEQCKRLRKRANYSAKGFCWHARIADARTEKILFDSPMAYVHRDGADRHGRRLIERWRETGSWTERRGVTVKIADEAE